MFPRNYYGWKLSPFNFYSFLKCNYLGLSRVSAIIRQGKDPPVNLERKSGRIMG